MLQQEGNKKECERHKNTVGRKDDEDKRSDKKQNAADGKLEKLEWGHQQSAIPSPSTCVTQRIRIPVNLPEWIFPVRSAK